MPYLTAAEIRAASAALEDDGKFPDATLDALVAEFETVAERYRGVAFEPRDVTGEEHLISRQRQSLALAHVYVSTVDTITVDDTELDPSSYLLDKIPGVIICRAGFGVDQLVTVDYTHGLTAPGDELQRACREYVRACALNDRSTVGRDVISQADGAGGTTRYSTPDWNAGRPTGWTEVDRILNALPDYRPNVG